VRTFLANRAAYVSNTHVRTFPDGMDVQVFSLETLIRSASMTGAALDREHVTLHIRSHPELFPPIHLVAPPELHWPELAVTLDEPADYELIKRIVECLSPSDPLFSCGKLIDLLRSNPQWLDLNRNVSRKGDS
jgi:spore coat polysaccharide biosynthesis protein SpsF